MTPVIVHLRNRFPDLPLEASHDLQWTFDEHIKLLGPDFYKKIASMHLVLHMEYSILCHQLQHDLAYPHQASQNRIIKQLKAALIFAQLLEQVHVHYLVIPHEAVRLRKHQSVYKDLLQQMAGYIFSPTSSKMEAELQKFSVTQYIRDSTGQANWFRLLVTRGKRVLNLLDLVDTGSAAYRHFVHLMDKYTNPFFAYLAWCFFIPRLSATLFLIAKHTIPWPWMEEKEKALGWYVRMRLRIERQSFEFANDLVWVCVGLLNCFLLVGALASLSIYLNLFAFTFDVINSSVRVYMELNRLYKLEKEYNALYCAADNEEDRETIKDQQRYMKYRIEFEKLRLNMHLAGTIVVLLGMCLAIPALALNPVLPFIGAVLILLTWVITYGLTHALENHRPSDNVEKPSGITQFGIFARKDEEQEKLSPYGLTVPLSPR